MSRNWLRRCVLKLAGSSSYSVPGGRDTDLSIEFAFGMSALQAPHPGRIRIYNPAPSLVSKFKDKEFSTIEFYAGYEDSCGFIYNGDIQQTLYAWDDNPTNKYLDIFTGCFSNAYQQARVGETLAAGWTPRDKLNVALKSMQPHGITGLGLCNVDLNNPKYPRGRPFIGMARDLIRQLSLSAAATWHMGIDGKVHIIDYKKPLSSDNNTVLLNSRTGKIGAAHQTENGVIVRCLINPSIGVGTAIKLEETVLEAERDNNVLPSEGQLRTNTDIDQTGRISADGIYRVAFLEIEGATRSNPWHMTLTCLATGAPFNSRQIGSYEGPNLGAY